MIGSFGRQDDGTVCIFTRVILSSGGSKEEQGQAQRRRGVVT